VPSANFPSTAGPGTAAPSGTFRNCPNGLTIC
jgi:hypothetical protein